jgi:MYXO-CTERM domain-containing protein
MTAPKVQRVCGWIIGVISVIHLIVTFVDYDELSLRAMWFVGSGFALLLIGGLNVITAGLDDAQFTALRGLRALTLLSDFCGLTLGSLFVVLTSGSQPQGHALVALFAIAGGAQLRRRAPR